MWVQVNVHMVTCLAQANIIHGYAH
jgi:hypothetical protein